MGVHKQSYLNWVGEEATAVQEMPIQRELIQRPICDVRLLEPGWAGELAPDELDFIQDRLREDRQTPFRWGFRPTSKRRPEWAIRQIAMHGDPDRRATNVALARRKLPDSRL